MRPQYGDVFNFDKLLNIFFYTSNIEKLIQAKLVFMRSGYQLRHFRSKCEPYSEDYSLGTQGLLANAVMQVSQSFGLRSIFFVEDTSMRLEALSSKEDYPGVRVKEWFESTTFEEVSRQIELRGGVRRAIVKSDIALRIPSLSRPIFFHGETVGNIALEPPSFEASIPYPWLTPNTFNGWFIPEGSSKRLGEMEFEESLEFDFRAKALRAAIERIEELNAALNFGARHSAKRRIGTGNSTSQPALFPSDQRKVLLIIGDKCAGKSTLSDFLTSQLSEVFALEASTLLRNLALGDNVVIDNSGSALKYLERKGWDPVAREAANCVAREGAKLAVVTGLRTVEELLYMKERFPNAKIVLVEADQKTRFERHIKRARDNDARTFKDFQQLDEEQARFGALRVAQEIADIVIRNEEDLGQYRRRIEDLTDRTKAKTLRLSEESELHRSLKALAKIGHAATCDEISVATSQQGRVVRKYNNNRSLKGVPEFATRIERAGHLLRYKLNNRGVALLRLLEIRYSPASE